MRKSLLPVLVALLLCTLTLAAQAEIVVGTDIADEEISEFFYIYSSSTYPPLYQQYRFYQENGEKLFYHEAREGGDWPQTEENITLSGTVKLTEEDWALFIDCLRGGSLDEGSEEVIDGDDGPWMFLSWAEGEEKHQEYRFASLSEQNAFERLCSRLAGNHVLTWFHIIRGGSMMPESFEIFLRKGVYYIRENEETPGEFDADLAEELQKIISSYDLFSWNGFHKSNPNVLDGESFSLGLRFADGITVNAYGENSFPEGYHDATNRIDAVLDTYKKRQLSGCYRYDGEGFDGAIILTLNEDSTFTFSEGPLSSCLGGGTWDAYSNAVYLTEESGDSRHYMFGYRDDQLIYLAGGSDEFPYIKISDVSLFKRFVPD